MVTMTKPAEVLQRTGLNPTLATLSAGNQIFIPESVAAYIPNAEYFEVANEDGRIVLTPVQIPSADAVRAKLAALGITEEDIADAVEWARRGRLP